MTVAALFVDARGCYAGLPDVDLWDEKRDARLYAGSDPVVAHPPCERWGRYWSSDGSTAPGKDGGCFASALASVRRCGGVLEHPEGSRAWAAFDLPPAELGHWSRGFCGGWSTCVAQRNYGHRATKLTWLYFFGDAAPPSLDWSEPEPPAAYLSQPGRCSSGKPRPRCICKRCQEHYGAAWIGRPDFSRMGAKENAATPLAFRDVLLATARSARPPVHDVSCMMDEDCDCPVSRL